MPTFHYLSDYDLPKSAAAPPSPLFRNGSAEYHATARGAAAFQTRDCERCHSILGVGGDHTPDLGTIGTRKSMSQIKTQIIKGGHGMPPFGDVLSKD
jgi:mono/diheme cytochrome c family protein